MFEVALCTVIVHKNFFLGGGGFCFHFDLYEYQIINNRVINL